MTVVSVLVALLLLGILITVHEFGHYIFARMTGIEVMEFAIGFGPKIVGWTGKSGTKFALRCIPLGGYCAFYGEDDVEGKATNDPRAFGKQPVWKRMLSVLMGPGMNFLLPLVVLVLYFWIGGVTGTEALVADVEQGGPAYTAGLQAGDIILDVNGTAPNPENASQSLTDLINASQGDAMVLGIRRDGERTEITLTPFYDAETGRYRMGIHVSAVASGEMLPVSFGEAVRDSWNVCVNAATIIGQALRDMVTTGARLNEVGGLVGTVAAVSEQVSTYGFAAFINALVVISINLGIMNLLPIPGLDGARFLFLLVTCAMWTVDVMACSVFLAFGDMMDSGWAGAMIPSAVIFAFSLIVGSILMAFSYRFTFRAMMRIFVVVIVGLYASVALLSRLPFDWQGLLQGVADFMSVWWRAALIAVVLCVGVYCISAALAIRFYRAKEL